MAKEMIRIRLKAYDHQVIDQSAEKIVETGLVEQGAEQPVGFGRIAVVGEPLLDADLLAVVAAAVEVVPDFI